MGLKWLLKEGISAPWSLTNSHPLQNEAEFKIICQLITGKNRGKVIKFNAHQYSSFLKGKIKSYLPNI